MTSTTSALTVEEIQSRLAQYHGTENYYRHSCGCCVYTDGVKAVADICNAYWLINAIGSHIPKVLENQSVMKSCSWTLTLNKASDRGAKLQCWELRPLEDEIVEVEYICQEIPYTDFPLSKIEFFMVFERGNFILLLPSEH